MVVMQFNTYFSSNCLRWTTIAVYQFSLDHTSKTVLVLTNLVLFMFVKQGKSDLHVPFFFFYFFSLLISLFILFHMAYIIWNMFYYPDDIGELTSWSLKKKIINIKEKVSAKTYISKIINKMWILVFNKGRSHNLSWIHLVKNMKKCKRFPTWHRRMPVWMTVVPSPSTEPSLVNKTCQELGF